MNWIKVSETLPSQFKYVLIKRKAHTSLGYEFFVASGFEDMKWIISILEPPGGTNVKISQPFLDEDEWMYVRWED